MQKKKVLLIDDEPDVTNLLKLYLEKSGPYEVREENRGEQALAAARAFNPDLILLDVMMPNVDGGQVAVQLKADEKLKDTPVIFLTAVVTKEQAKKQQGWIGGHPFIAKPASPEEILESIEKYLTKKQRSVPCPVQDGREGVAMPKKRILLIDDDPDLTSLLKMCLENTGAYEAREENHSDQALAAAREFRPDLILLDMMMPNILGGKVAAQLEADEELKDTPLVFLSAVVTEDAKAHGSTIAGHPAIPKPASPEEVISFIEKHLPKKILIIHREDDFTAQLKLSIDRDPEYKTWVAASGEQAVKLVETRNPDLVLLDITTPDLGGLETLKRIKAIAADIPVAMLTDDYKEEEAKRCLDAGAHDYIAKPVKFEYLRTALSAKLPS